MEHRSTIGGLYKSTIIFAWILAGIHGALKRQAPTEAQARCGLELAALGQFSLDGGDWTLALELFFEPPPPVSAFNTHTVDNVSTPCSQLVDPRFFEVSLTRIKDIGDILERRKRLKAARTTTKPDPKPKPNPKSGLTEKEKKKEKAKAKEKANAKRKNKGEEDAENPV